MRGTRGREGTKVLKILQMSYVNFPKRHSFLLSVCRKSPTKYGMEARGGERYTISCPSEREPYLNRQKIRVPTERETHLGTEVGAHCIVTPVTPKLGDPIYINAFKVLQCRLSCQMLHFPYGANKITVVLAYI